MRTIKPYTILPYRFMRFKDEVLLVNEAGDFIFVKNTDFDKFRKFELRTQAEIFFNLKSKHLVTESNLSLPIYQLATKYRTKKSFLNDFTALHIFILTLRCNQNCRYCQAGSENETCYEHDMDISIAKKCVDYVFKSPSPVIKIEFQGGEPLLNFEVLKFVVKYAKALNKKHKKDLEFVVCTNLIALSDKILKFLKKNKILISTSLDGPRNIHDANRILPNGEGTYEIVLKNIKRAQVTTGAQNVAALMVTTKSNFHNLEKVVDEYIAKGFDSIFFRTLHPFGRAARERNTLGYDIEEFVRNYKKALNYIIEINLSGKYFSEIYATIVLSRILTPFSTGFVDLQSPAGTGIGCAVYSQNGDVFVSDEARMLAKMGDLRFRIGNVKENTYKEIFDGKNLREIISSSCVETLPQCSECAFQMYCGADPVRNYYAQGSLIGHKPTSEFHERNYLIIKHLFELIRQDDPEIMNVFWSWITNRSIYDIKRINIRELNEKPNR